MHSGTIPSPRKPSYEPSHEGSGEPRNEAGKVSNEAEPAYRVGSRVEITRFTGYGNELPIGTRGTVLGWSEEKGQLAVAWDNGNNLIAHISLGDQVAVLGTHHEFPPDTPGDDTRA